VKRGGILCILVLAVALFFLAVPYAANAATFNCTIRTSSCNANETPLVYLNSSESGNAPNNSHAMLANYSGALYPYVVCCWTDAFRTLSNTCGGNGIAVLRLNQTTDSHVEAGNMTTAIYPFKACLNVTSGNITCEYPTSTCSAGYSPVLSIASSDTGDGNLTNAHIGDYALYNRKTCCAVGGQNPPTIAYTNISPNGTATTRQDLECQNGSVTDADGDTVTLHYNWYLNDTSATLLNLPMDYDSNTGTTHDISGYANHGTISSEIDFYPISGYIGGGFSIGALAGFIIIPASPVFNFSTNDFSYAVWTNYSSLASLILFDTRNSSGNGFALIISGNTVKCLISNGTIVQTSTLGTSGANAWHHYICVRNSTALTLFKDGALFKTVSTTNVNVNTSSENLTFSFGTNTEDSFIDEVMIFNRSLTPSEIQALYATNNRWFNSTELRRGNGWNCSITPIDSTGLNGSTKYSNRTIINGSAPLNVSLLYPLNNNQSVFERNVNFSWSTADERDGDTVTYNLSANVTPGLCGAQVAVNPTTTNYTSSELCVDQLYNWTVRACDVDGCSAPSRAWYR